jgi:hypothetical protein
VGVTQLWLRLQASARCRACAELTPVNAAVERLACASCGASFTLRGDLWRNVLEDAVTTARELDANATTSRNFDPQGMTLSVAITAVPPSCPHCEAAWASVPDGSCPNCASEVSVRELGPGTLVGEDRHLLAAERRAPEPETLSCSGCGSPMSASGSSRKLVCESCARETVIPDEIWRRLHAPSSVANWWLVTEGSVELGLRHRLRPTSTAAGSNRLYALATYGDTPFSLLAVQLSPLALRWMVDLEAIGHAQLGVGTVVLRGNELFAFHLLAKAIEVFDTDTGRHLRTVAVPASLTDVAVDPDGSIVCVTVTGGVIRVDASGRELPLWSRGWLARLFGGGGSARRMVESGGKLAVGHDGELRFVQANTIGRIGRGGERRWMVEIADVNGAIVSPAAAADGTTWAVFRTVGGTMTAEQLLEQTVAMLAGNRQSTSALVRVSPDGAQVDVVRRSGDDEYTSLAVTPEGEVWLGTGEGELLQLAANGDLLWQQPSSSDDD